MAAGRVLQRSDRWLPISLAIAIAALLGALAVSKRRAPLPGDGLVPSLAEKPSKDGDDAAPAQPRPAKKAKQKKKKSKKSGKKKSKKAAQKDGGKKQG